METSAVAASPAAPTWDARSARPAGTGVPWWWRVAGTAVLWWWRVAGSVGRLLLVSFLEGIVLLLGSSEANTRALPWRCSRAQSISVHQSQREPCRKQKRKSAIVLLLIVPVHKVVFSSAVPTFIHNGRCMGLILLLAAQVALR